MKILFCIIILLDLVNLITSNEDVFNDMSPEERRFFFGTEDGSIPEYEVVELELPSRSKRSTVEPINITLNGVCSTSYLYVIKDDDLISRSQTGVWTAVHNPNAYQGVAYTPWPELLKDIGNITFFGNPWEDTAITRFIDEDGDEIILGILQQNYTIKSAPKNCVRKLRDIRAKRDLERRSADSINDQDAKTSFLVVFRNNESSKNYVSRYNYARREAFADPRLHRVTRDSIHPANKPAIVYPKLLVVPDANLISQSGSSQALLRQIIAQLNFANLMFRQLDAPEVHLAISGIIIPMNDYAMPYMKPKQGFDYPIRAMVATRKARLHFLQETRRFPDNRWNSILILTSKPIFINSTEVDGYVEEAMACKHGATIMKFGVSSRYARTLVHELSYMLSSNVDEDDTANVIIGDIHSYPTNVWINHRRNALESYFRSNAASCTHSKPQRISDSIIHMSGAWLTIGAQCDNFCEDCKGHCMKVIYEPTLCLKNACVRNETCDVPFKPLEGTVISGYQLSQFCDSDESPMG